MEIEGALQLKVEKIIRSRAYETRFWKEECFGLTAETIVDKAVELDHIGGQFGNQTPTHFLCLVIKLLQIEPSKEIVLEYVQDPEFKYLRALGAFYLRLTFPSTEIYTHLEPLLTDYRKLRIRNSAANAGNEYALTYMDQFIDDLFMEDRVCDVILPRIPPRSVLEETGDLVGPRVSLIQAEFDATLVSDSASSKTSSTSQHVSPTDDHDDGAVVVQDELMDSVINNPHEFKVSMKKIAKLFKSSAKPVTRPIRTTDTQLDRHSDSDSDNNGFRECMSIDETNALRIKMGLKPLVP